MEARTIAASRVTLSRLMGPQDANSLGNIHGGIIMKMVDEAGALAAMRHARNAAVTVAIDSMSFKQPIRVGDVVTARAELTYAGRTSMEVRIDVTAEHPFQGTVTHTNSAYIVYVALDSSGKATEVPPLLLETEQEKQRWKAAEKRQEYRKRLRAEEESPSND